MSYGEVTALRGVSLSAGPGEFVAITGHSGAGKTTLINAIAGIVPVAGGQVDLGGGSDSSMDLDTVAIIPHTEAVTTLATKRAGDRVNLEVDVNAKYVEKLLAWRTEGE